MGRHALNVTGRPEPIAIAAAIQGVLAALVAVGWITVDDTTVNAIGTVVAAIAAGVITVTARSKVTPLSDPRTPDGVPLKPVIDEREEP